MAIYRKLKISLRKPKKLKMAVIRIIIMAWIPSLMMLKLIKGKEIKNRLPTRILRLSLGILMALIY